MKKKKLSCVFFLLLFTFMFVISLVGVAYLLRPVTNSRKNVCGFYAEEDNTLDMVYVGGSACYTFREPLAAWNEYGYTSYNFATDALQPQSIKYILEEIQKTQSPEVYVVDLRPFQYGDVLNIEENTTNMERVAPFRNLCDNMKYSKNRMDLIKNGAPSAEEEWTYLFDLAKYHSNIVSLTQKENWEYIFNSKKLYSKGFIGYESARVIPYEDTQSITTEQPLEDSVDALLIDLLEYCKQKDLNVLFIVHVYYNTAEDRQKYNYMKRTIEEYKQGYLNVNDYFFEIGFDVEQDFHDGNHVNLQGADKYTEFLADYLKAHYELPDKRNDADYEQWNLDYEFWNSEMDMIRADLNEKVERKE